MKILNSILLLFVMTVVQPALGASVVATVNGTPITDTDITLRTQLMARQGKTSTDNRRVALQNIIDDNIKITYAHNFNAVPEDDIVDKELQKMNLGDIGGAEKEMARNALRAEIAWQIIVARTVLPTVDVTSEDINAEKANIPLSVCGEMAGRHDSVMVLGGMGIRHLSMSPKLICSTKELLSRFTIQELEAISAKHLNNFYEE